jgi:hypothetical protein
MPACREPSNRSNKNGAGGGEDDKYVGIVGEYVGAMHTQVLKRPLVIEKERINFD